MQMAGRQPGVVGDVVVAGLHRGERIDVEKMSDRVGHGVHVTRGAGDRLRQHAAVAVEHARRRSPASRTGVLNAVRSIVCACSSTTAIRRLHMIWVWI